jgi:ubiquinone/menaquinone biosynthesis C-methylase UbiE
MGIDFKRRSYELEYIDTGDYTPDEYQGCIVELKRVNRWLGDTRTLRRTLLREVEERRLREFSVLDVGAGSGELLRATAAWARKTKRSAKLVGLELNPDSARAMETDSADFPTLSAVQGDAFELPFAEKQFDFVISSLFTHHLTDNQVVAVFREMARVARLGICVIDLHRHPIAYYFYTTIGRLILYNRLLRHDGALSILKSFKPRELLALARQAGLSNARVERHFPYRLVIRASLESTAKTSTIEQPLQDTATDRAA